MHKTQEISFNECFGSAFDKYIICDFESPAEYHQIGFEDHVNPAYGTGEIESNNPQEGQNCFRINFDYPRAGTAIFLYAIPVQKDQIPSKPWGLEFWCRMDGHYPIYLETLIEERDGELWRAGATLRKDAAATQWHHVRIPFYGVTNLSWTRVNGKFDPENIKSIRPFFSSMDYSSALKGTIWVDTISILDVNRVVSTRQQGDYLLLNLENAYNSDALAWKSNPTDGDFHTGDWEPRTYPAEYFPQMSPATFQNIPFLPPPLDDGKDNNIRCNGQRIIGFPESSVSAIYFLATSKFGDQKGNVILEYADGSTDRVGLIVSDSCREAHLGEVSAIKAPIAYHEHRIDNRKPEIFIQSIQSDPNKKLSAINLPLNDNLRIFSITLSQSSRPLSVGSLQKKSLEEIDPRLKMPDTLDLDFKEPVRPVGVLGGYVHRKGSRFTLEIPPLNGYLTYASDANYIPGQTLIWDKFQNMYPAFELGGFQTNGRMNKELDVDLLDSTCIKYSSDIYTTASKAVFEYSVYMSRAWPAALYDIKSKSIFWKVPARKGKTRISYIRGGEVKTSLFKVGDEVPVPDQPWLMIWHSDESGQQEFDVPMLLVLEKRPIRIEFKTKRIPDKPTKEIWFDFSSSTGLVSAMPLFGVKRQDKTIMNQWAEKGIPDSVVNQCKNWSERLQRFPVVLRQEFKIDEAEKRIEISDSFDWIDLKSDWAVKPRPFTPLPPVAVLAQMNKYPVEFQDGVIDGNISTFWGPLYGMESESVSYSIPMSTYSDNVLAPAQVLQSRIADQIAKEFKKLIKRTIPDEFNPLTLRSDTCGNLALLRIVSPSRLITGESKHVAEFGRAVVENAFKDENLKIEKEPLSGQYYLMDDRFWAKDAVYDKEWAIGFMMQGFWNYAWYQDGYNLISENWNKIRGLYRYYQIVFDWTTSSTWTMATGGGANSDGSRIAWEGMVAMARMAKEVGDNDAWEDAIIRSSRQMMSLYASWFAPNWAIEIDYVIRNNHHIPAENTETRFSPDVIWTETFTCNTSYHSNFFQATHAFYIFNLAHLLFLHDYGLDESKLRPWLYEIVPQIHPDWSDGNALSVKNNHYYGDNAAMAHLIARALLFHQNAQSLYDLYEQCVRNTEVTKQWYTPMGQAPFALASMITGQAPLAIIPIRGWRIEKNTYFAKDRKQVIELQAVENAQGRLRLRCWGTPPERVMINDKEVFVEWYAETDYAEIPLKARTGEICKIVAQYP